MKSKMIYIILILFIVIGISTYCFLKPKFKITQTLESPDKAYVLEVYTQTNFKASGLSNQQGFKKAYVLLKDANNNIIAKPSIFSSCQFILEDLNVYWELDDNKVYFTKFNYINLIDKSYSCQ